MSQNEFRSRKHEASSFWNSLRWSAHRGPEDRGETEFPELSQALRNTLLRSGLNCRVKVMTCPDWMLRTVPNLGKKGMATLRQSTPFNANASYLESCPTRKREKTGPQQDV